MNTSGLAQARVGAGTTVAIGDYLTAGANGAVVVAERGTVPTTAARVMSAPDTDGLVWVMLGGQ